MRSFFQIKTGRRSHRILLRSRSQQSRNFQLSGINMFGFGGVGLFNFLSRDCNRPKKTDITDQFQKHLPSSRILTGAYSFTGAQTRCVFETPIMIQFLWVLSRCPKLNDVHFKFLYMKASSEQPHILVPLRLFSISSFYCSSSQFNLSSSH